VFLPSENAESAVVCLEQKKLKHSVTVMDNTLIIRLTDTRAWYEHIGISFKTPKITVYLPREEYGTLQIKSHTGDVNVPGDFKFDSMDISESTGDVTNHASVLNGMKIQTSTGNITVRNVSAGKLELSVTTGKITASDVSCAGEIKVSVSTGDAKLTNISCDSFRSNGNTGELSLKDVIATGSFAIVRSTGDVEFDGCDAAEIVIRTSTGDIEGSLLSEKVFSTKTDTGEVEVPRSTSGGKCELRTTTGDIEVEIGRK